MKSEILLTAARLFMVTCVFVAAACSSRSASPTQLIPLPTMTPAPTTPATPVVATPTQALQPATSTPSNDTQATAVVATLAAGVVPHLQIVYAQVDGVSLVLDVYQPVLRSAARPAVVLIHGGAGSHGDRTDLGEHAKALANAGYVAFNIEYRLLDGVKNAWPTQLSDAQLAVRWVRANAAKYNVDPQRICALGHSFGGQLSALLGMRDTSTQGDQALPAYSSHVTCVVDIAGSVDPTQPLHGRGEGLDIALMGGTASQQPARYRDASPLAQVTSSTAPFLIFHGVDDEVVPVDESRQLVDALHKASVPVVYKEYPHADHFYWINYFNPGAWAFVAPETLEFLDRYLHPAS